MDTCELKRSISLKLPSTYLLLKSSLLDVVGNNALANGFGNKVHKKIL
jgi:hypothetical protein